MKNGGKPKLLFFVEAMGGGVFTYIVDLSNQLTDIYDIYIAYAIRLQTPKDYRIYFNNKIKLIKVENFERSIDLCNDIKALIEMKKIAKEIKPDIIHLHSSKAGVLGRIGFNGKKIPLFYTPHGYSFLMSDCKWTKRMIYKCIEAACALKKCMTVSCSEGEHRETLKLTKNATYINNGINTEEMEKFILNNRLYPRQNEDFVVATLGRICEQKNPVLFNAIAERLPNIKFIWIGDGELRSELTSNNIEITGWRSRKEALEYLLNTNMFILTSLWEGLPISLLESMYMKKLCIVSDVVGNRDVIKNGVNGYVCKDIDEFVRCIEQAKEHVPVTLIEEAYRNIIDEYNIEVMSKKYNQVYNEKQK